ncbi:aromatic acid exporter family member 1 [Cryobacterium psychrophilum]|uniref:FUSC family protein n=1 Tax=Cryobacterium psychrophilum TaxID=41988 RepID=A0A4Y8KWU3_9MICO|nr:aromatic acid exporter family protein [Cryobacterium psychrophilum]TDW28811.1 aromatic acid exporter family member 1 [Cryobacterium psychrophilum]TFD82455.1 FUSC family protein [Cryobacterium psychrophilum]
MLKWPRTHFAFKAALAAGLAFLIAPHMPGVAAQYAYYAPLGALVSMYPTVAGTLRQGMHTLVGLTLGIGLAFLLIAFGTPTALTVGVLVGIGILLAGIPKLGAGTDWIPSVALFVLLVGGKNAENMSFGYLVQIAVGVTVGLAVNVLVFPPLNFDAATASVNRLHLVLSQQLKDMGNALQEQWPPRHEDWALRTGALSDAARAVRLAVQKADDSRRANPRRRRYPRDLNADYRTVENLERVTFHIRDITEVLSDVIWNEDAPYAIPELLSLPLGAAMSAVGELLQLLEGEDIDQRKRLQDTATALVDQLIAQAGRVRGDDPKNTPDSAGAIVLSLHRILRVLRQ